VLAFDGLSRTCFAEAETKMPRNSSIGMTIANPFFDPLRGPALWLATPRQKWRGWLADISAAAG